MRCKQRVKGNKKCSQEGLTKYDGYCWRHGTKDKNRSVKKIKQPATGDLLIGLIRVIIREEMSNILKGGLDT